MNLSRDQLATEYRRAIGALPWVHEVERQYGLPPYLLFAVWSRETDVDLGYLHGKVGDFGFGHGPWQLDDHPQNWSSQRQADCNSIDAGDMRLAAVLAAGELAANLTHEAGDLVRALNRYNSGSPNTSATTGRDYGPDVAERRAVLEEMFGPPRRRPRKDDMAQMLAESGKSKELQFRAEPGTVFLYADHVGDWDAGAKKFKGTGAVSSRLAIGSETNGWMIIEDVGVLPKTKDQAYRLPGDVRGGVVLSVRPNDAGAGCSAEVVYDSELPEVPAAQAFELTHPPE